MPPGLLHPERRGAVRTPNRRRGAARGGWKWAGRGRGHTREGGWGEMPRTGDAPLGGCSFVLPRALLRGRVPHLALPLPKAFRRYDLQEGGYSVYALVRSSTRL